MTGKRASIGGSSGGPISTLSDEFTNKLAVADTQVTEWFGGDHSGPVENRLLGTTGAKGRLGIMTTATMSSDNDGI